jgi:hypothetical protein
MDNNGFWPKKDNLPILNIAFDAFWDVDEIIFEYYFKTSHCFLWSSYDVRYNPNDPDVVFTSVFGNPNLNKWPNIPRVLLVHEPVPVTSNTVYDSFKAVISFTPSFGNNIRIPYWVYRIFDQYASHHFPDDPHPFDDYLFRNYIKFRNPIALDERKKFCGFVQGKSVPWRDTVFEWLNEYRPVDSGGSLFSNLPYGVEKDYMAKRLMGREANMQKSLFFDSRKFAFCMENTMDMVGYTTEKIIDAYYAGAIPLYAGQMLPEDGFNKKAFINLYDYDSKDAFMNEVKLIDGSKELEIVMRTQPLFSNYPEQFTLDGMLSTYAKFFER